MQYLGRNVVLRCKCKRRRQLRTWQRRRIRDHRQHLFSQSLMRGKRKISRIRSTGVRNQHAPKLLERSLQHSGFGSKIHKQILVEMPRRWPKSPIEPHPSRLCEG